MVKTSIEKISREIGYDIGHSDDVTQSNLINGFSKAITQGCGNEIDTQICYIADKLTKESKEVIKLLYEYSKIDN